LSLDRAGGIAAAVNPLVNPGGSVTRRGVHAAAAAPFCGSNAKAVEGARVAGRLGASAKPCDLRGRMIGLVSQPGLRAALLLAAALVMGGSASRAQSPPVALLPEITVSAPAALSAAASAWGMATPPVTTVSG
jgi:hypothetical protein